MAFAEPPGFSESAVIPRRRHIRKLRLGEANELVQGHGNLERCLLSSAGSFLPLMAQGGVLGEGGRGSK